MEAVQASLQERHFEQLSAIMDKAELEVSWSIVRSNAKHFRPARLVLTSAPHLSTFAAPKPSSLGGLASRAAPTQPRVQQAIVGSGLQRASDLGLPMWSLIITSIPPCTYADRTPACYGSAFLWL